MVYFEKHFQNFYNSKHSALGQLSSTNYYLPQLKPTLLVYTQKEWSKKQKWVRTEIRKR